MQEYLCLLYTSVEQEAGKRHERYFTRGNADSWLCAAGDQRDIPEFRFYTDWDQIRRKKGVDELSENFSFAEYKNNEYDKLAKILRENLDMKKIYEIMDGE